MIVIQYNSIIEQSSKNDLYWNSIKYFFEVIN